MDLEEDYSKHFHNKPKIKEKDIYEGLNQYFISILEYFEEMRHSCADYVLNLRELDERIKECDKMTFSDLLFKIIKSENIDEVELYKKADMDRRLFSKIRSNRHYTPSKETVIKLIFALEADSEISEELMSLAGYRLKENLLSDAIVKFFIDNNIYNKALLDEALAHYEQKTIFSKE